MDFIHELARFCVRPLAGAGIEIVQPFQNCTNLRVRPLAGAGIEMMISPSSSTPQWVRPLAGAGIEIPRDRSPANKSQ